MWINSVLLRLLLACWFAQNKTLSFDKERYKMQTPMDIFVKEMQELFCPDEVYIMDGCQEEAERLTEIAQKKEIA